jgi:acyl-[acyl-carrier-protein]-phospholipid O-acyltransferase/long-chain-fatty-acid--[acyl-carrier-protein] ligase
MVLSFLRRQLTSFTYLNITQFLGALNDNLYKLLITYFLIQMQGVEQSQHIIAMAGAVFVIPFLIFSEGSGTLADRLSKRNIIVFTKVFELLVMSLGFSAFYFESSFGAYATVFLMATQSALFGPSKYGIVPELVESEKISTANGLLTSFTFLAIIIGTFLASFILDLTDRNYLLASAFCIALSFVGVLTSFCIEYTPPAGSNKRFNVLFISEIWKSLKIAHQYPNLLLSILGSSFFLFVGAFIQLNTIPFALQILNLTDLQGGYLFLLTALGIGTGSIIAGKLSGKIVELGLVPIGGIGITIAFFLLDGYSDSLVSVICLMVFIGVFGGIYLLPLDTFIQVASPPTQRGQLVAATNFLGFMGVLAASGLLYLTQFLSLKADKGYTIMGILCFLVTAAIMVKTSDYFVRFLAMVISRIRFRAIAKGQEIIPRGKPALYLCRHTAWNDTLLLLGSQHRRMRFFTTEWNDENTWLKNLHKRLPIIQTPSIEPLDHNQHYLDEILKTLDRQVSVCVFVPQSTSKESYKALVEQYRAILKETSYALIQTHVEKGVKEPKKNPLYSRLHERLRVPALIRFEMLQEGQAQTN